MSRPEGPGALHEKPRTLGRETGEAPVCFRDFMGYHGISRAVKERTGFRVAPGDTDATFIQQRLGLRNGSKCVWLPTPRGWAVPKRAAPPTLSVDGAPTCQLACKPGSVWRLSRAV